MSQLTLNILGPMLFSYTGYFWGFLLAAIAVEELQELNSQLNKTRNLLALITTAIILYIGISEIKSQIIFASVLIICAISIIFIQHWGKSFKQELYILAPISIAYLSILFMDFSVEKILILSSTVLLYFILAGINSHYFILHKTKK